MGELIAFPGCDPVRNNDGPDPLEDVFDSQLVADFRARCDRGCEERGLSPVNAKYVTLAMFYGAIYLMDLVNDPNMVRLLKREADLLCK